MRALDSRLRGQRRARDVDRFGDQPDLEEEIGQLLLVGDDLRRDRLDAVDAPLLDLEQNAFIQPGFTGDELGDLFGMVCSPGSVSVSASPSVASASAFSVAKVRAAR